MDLAVRAAALAVTAAVLGLVLRKNAPELGFALALAAAGAILALAARLGPNVRGAVTMAQEVTGLSAAVVQPVVKCVGIGVLTRLAADFCADAGQSAAGSAVEICGAVCALAAAMPLMESFLTMIGRML